MGRRNLCLLDPSDSAIGLIVEPRLPRNLLTIVRTMKLILWNRMCVSRGGSSSGVNEDRETIYNSLVLTIIDKVSKLTQTSEHQLDRMGR